MAEQLGNDLEDIEALIIRTLPNDDLKLTANYSGANAPYLHVDAIHAMVEAGIDHLLLDLPSVDKEEDDGELEGHKAFWKYPTNTRKHATITELIYVQGSIEDGEYSLNLMVAPIGQDAAPSWPVLYK